MQHRMKTNQLTREQADALLRRAETGSLATLGEDGAPYATPMHYVYEDGCIYMHGLPVGQKMQNIKADPRVSFAVYEMEGLLLDGEGKPCDTNTKYQSVIVAGAATLVEDLAEKNAALVAIVKKYTPHLADTPLPETMVRGTGVIAIRDLTITGKYYG